MILEEFYTLSNGKNIPKLGLGTWFIDNDKAAHAVKEAVNCGYRMIDTAQAYGNEQGVGEGIRNCGIPREQLFVANKVAAELKTYEEAAASIDESLKKTGLSYFDQMIIHSPQPWNEFRSEKRYFEENRQVWKALEDAYEAGKIKVIGVSNFLKDDLENILNSCKVKPMVNQILLHISNTDTQLLDYCSKNDILVEAYSPIAHGEALKNREIVNMARSYNVSPAQLCIAYALQLGTVALPKTSNPDHMRSNAEINFEISKTDMEALKAMKKIESYGDFDVFPVFGKKSLY
ncbi:MAG: aldo/keto reductase [Clostridia bacterium]|nr:aldo/keto reductase [Clostridia bacterium]